VQSGGGLRSGMPLTVSMLPDRIVAADDQRAAFSIPAPAVVAVTYHTAVKGPASAWWNFWSGAVEDPGEALIALPVVLAVGALLELGRSNEHYITIDWREAGRLRELQLQVNSADYQPLLGELQAVTHRGWKSLPNEIHNLRSALEREAANSVPVEFDRSIRLGWTEVPAGSYRLIVLERSPKRGELYLFPAERADLDRVLAQAVVELAERTATSGTVQVSYKEENGIATLSEIRAGARSLRFTAVPVNVAE
jgi:hypothetical protein